VLLLAVDTSGTQVSVALHDGDRLSARRDVADPRRHAEVLAPSLTSMLDEAGRQLHEVSDLAVGVGPGPFTGLRVGLVTAEMLGHVLGVPIHGVCSLDALAWGAVRAGTVGPAQEFLVTSDARRREVYWARYRGGRRLTGPAVVEPAELPRDGLPVIGRGGLLYPEVLGPAREPFDVSAADVAELAVAALAGDSRVETLLPVQPLYLRRPDAVEQAARKRVLS
jgi:tRNA threonylcarbamoyladenosine biosynthesis protein TsaB